MKLGDVLSGCRYDAMECEVPFGREGEERVFDTEIAGVAYDSRKVVKDGIFVAVKGENLDGHDYIGNAVAKGAAVIVHEGAAGSEGSGVTREEQDNDSSLVARHPSHVFIRVDDSRKALACIANNFFGRPSEDILVTGVTGTNGKTTTSYLVKSILEAWKKRVGLIGTIAHCIGDSRYPALHTTPEAVEFQGLLREMVSAGCSHVVSEVSSHSLSQKRVDYTRFVVVVFTNLTRDHLDFHGTMEDYFTAKERLFTELLSAAGTAVINVDDEWGKKLLERMKEIQRDERHENMRPSIITYGTLREADVSVSGREDKPSGLSFDVICREAEYHMDSSLMGTPNVYNILAAVATGIALNVPMSAIQEGIRNAGFVKGRLEKVDAGQDFLCIIDYAHTPDALERLILTARTLLKNKDRPGRVITLFGCGGDRDRGKRPLMGEIATRLSDYVIITSDNPRSENPGDIIREIVSGAALSNYVTVSDRKEAINAAVRKAGKGDVLLIAGKGHEDYQEIRGVRCVFSDRKAAEEAIRKRLRGEIAIK
jgi:UDP-N-acetylmuramoyl-L-alanyl-D-glutamate--2,6-diaminopimelate ligase